MTSKLLQFWEIFLDLFFPRTQIADLIPIQSQIQIDEAPALDLSSTYTKLDTVIVASDYELIKPVLIRFKYHFEKYLAADLGYILYQKVNQKLQQKELILPDFITFVPGDKKRVAARGFNSPELLAKILSKKLALKSMDIFLKSKTTVAQAKQDRSQRLQNLNQVFELKPSNQLDLNQIKHIWLIDDVIATGTTVSLLSELLKSKYPQILITTIVLARTEA